MAVVLDIIRKAVAKALNPIMLQDFTVTVDPQGDNVAYSCRGFVDDDIESHTRRGLTVEGGQRVIVLLQHLSPTLTNISEGDNIDGPTDYPDRNEESVVKDVRRDPADATWSLAVAP